MLLVSSMARIVPFHSSPVMNIHARPCRIPDIFQEASSGVVVVRCKNDTC